MYEQLAKDEIEGRTILNFEMLDDHFTRTLQEIEEEKKLKQKMRQMKLEAEKSTENESNDGKAVNLLDAGRIQEITILLTGYPLEFEETIDSLLTMDAQNILTPEIVTKLFKVSPTADEQPVFDEFVKKGG